MTFEDSGLFLEVESKPLNFSSTLVVDLLVF